MKGWLSFLSSELSAFEGKDILPMDRSKDLDFEWVPENPEQFEIFVANVPHRIVEGFGFIRYKCLPELYQVEHKEVSKIIAESFELFLIPAEWYSVIPAGYTLIDIFGKVFNFVPAISDQDVRDGCLSYGIALQSPVGSSENGSL